MSEKLKCHLCGGWGFHDDTCPHWPNGDGSHNAETEIATGWGDVHRGMAYDGNGKLTSITVDGVVFVPQVEMNKVTKQALDAELLKACLYWEAYPDKPATYLINRRNELDILFDPYKSGDARLKEITLPTEDK